VNRLLAAAFELELPIELVATKANVPAVEPTERLKLALVSVASTDAEVTAIAVGFEKANLAPARFNPVDGDVGPNRIERRGFPAQRVGGGC
jgi:hypothetical protein